MKKNTKSGENKKNVFEHFAANVTRATGSPAAFVLAFVVIIVWGFTGPLFNYSDTWQLVINTGTTVITFLMVFIIQQTQNKETTAIQLKLNELIAASSHASNRLVDIEELSAEDLVILKKFYTKLSELAKNESDIHKSHSLDEAKSIHKEKTKLGAG
jgi:low affinity Fe/Cu permease